LALLVLNPKTLDLELKVGILESYKPSKEIKALYKLHEKIKSEFQSKLSELTDGATDTKVIMQILDNPEKKQLWVAYLEQEFNLKIAELKNELVRINQKICPNFEELK
jgi:hypothetical protein